MGPCARRFERWLPWVPMVLLLFVAYVTVALTNWLGPDGIILAIACALVALLLWPTLAFMLWSAADRRRRADRYVICEADYADAPRPIKSTMRRIYRLAQSVRSGPAYQRDMFGELGLDQLVYSAAERAILSSDLSAAARDLRPDAMANDRALLDDANAQIQGIKDELSAIEATLKRCSKTADNLSQSMTAPERRRADEQAREQAAAAAADRRERARSRLEEVNVRAITRPDVDGGEVEDKVRAVAAGYDEVRQVTEGILGGGKGNGARRDDVAKDSNNTVRDNAFRAVKFATAQATKLSVAAAKARADKLKNRDGGG